MPEINDTVRFLYSCLNHHDGTKIDFKAIGAEYGLNTGTASMRFYRIKKAIEKAPGNPNGDDTIGGDDDVEAAKPKTPKKRKTEGQHAEGKATKKSKAEDVKVKNEDFED